MAWIEFHQSLRKHPKLHGLCKTLQSKPAHMAGHLGFLWLWAMDYAMDGNLSQFSNSQIAEAAEWDSDPTKFVSALIKHGFIDNRKIKPHGKQRQKRNIHDWYDFCGEIVKKRLLRRSERRTKSAEIRRAAAEMPPTNRTVPTVPKERENGSAHPPAVFSKPTPEEVTAYARSIGFELDGRHFCDVYESKGWLIGKSPMKNWKASVRTWKRKPVDQEFPKEPLHVN